jgi:hypothetical protein
VDGLRAKKPDRYPENGPNGRRAAGQAMRAGLFFVANGSSSEILTQLLILLGHNENMKGALYLNGLYTVSTDMKKKILDLVDSFISCDEETAPKLVDLVNNYYTE